LPEHFQYLLASNLLVVPQDNHVGSALFAGTISAGHLVIGFVFAGLLVRSLPCTYRSSDH